VRTLRQRPILPSSWISVSRVASAVRGRLARATDSGHQAERVTIRPIPVSEPFPTCVPGRMAPPGHAGLRPASTPYTNCREPDRQRRPPGVTGLGHGAALTLAATVGRRPWDRRQDARPLRSRLSAQHHSRPTAKAQVSESVPLRAAERVTSQVIRALPRTVIGADGRSQSNSRLICPARAVSVLIDDGQQIRSIWRDRPCGHWVVLCLLVAGSCGASRELAPCPRRRPDVRWFSVTGWCPGRRAGRGGAGRGS
jgi:hypothetical protein